MLLNATPGLFMESPPATEQTRLYLFSRTDIKLQSEKTEVTF